MMEERKRIRGILGAGEGGEAGRSGERKKEVACSQQRGRGKSCEIARRIKESASLGLRLGAMRAFAFPLVSLSLFVPVVFFFSIFLPLSSVTVSLPAWHCIVAVSAVKVLAGGFSLSEP